MGMANTAQLAEKYHRSPSEITEKILNLKNLLKNHEDIRELYPEYFRMKENSRSDQLCVWVKEAVRQLTLKSQKEEAGACTAGLLGNQPGSC
mgnify:FL=1